MPDRYYTRVEENDGVTVRMVMIDTAPLLDKYRKDTEKYPDACKQNMDKQLAMARLCTHYSKKKTGYW